MTFNIIYTPNSVQYLSFFVWSLLDNSPYHFRLVANGCSVKERAILQKMASKSERLSYYGFPSYTMQIHGKVLNHLQAMCREKYFCFLDSDIFATAPLPDLEALMEQQKRCGLFSAMPIWVKKTDMRCQANFRDMIGTFNHFEDGICLGSTYFAVYDNASLGQIMQYYSLCFDECKRIELPPNIQQELQKMGYTQQHFDTGKVINLFLNKHHFKLENESIAALCHIGGISYESIYQQAREEAASSLPIQKLKTLWANLSNRKAKKFQKAYKNAPKQEYEINYRQRILHRNKTRQHFLKLYLALSKQQSVPSVSNFEDAEIYTNVKAAHAAYVKNFNNFC